MARPHRHARAGFLLTETLATFTISAFVLLGLVSASSVLLRAVDRSVARVQDGDDLARTLDAITRDVSGLSRARFDGFEPQPFVFRGGPNSLFFARRERGVDGLPETRVIALREIVSADGPRLVRADALLPARVASFGGLHYGPSRDLATGSARLRFFYMARDKHDGAAPSPLRSWPIGTALPAAILIQAVEAGSGRVILSSRVPIRANADIGCIVANAATPGIGPGPAALAAPAGPAAPPPGLAPSPIAQVAAPGVSDNGDFCSGPNDERPPPGGPR